MGETGLIVAVPEAEPFVGDLRSRFDFRSGEGVPAHITVLYPFAPQPLSSEVLDRLRRLFESFESFEYRLQTVVRWPGSLHLAPAPSDGFVALTKAVWAAFPSYPPYEGRFAEIVPHLTVAQGDDLLIDVAEPLLRKAIPTKGIAANCSEVCLLVEAEGMWRPILRFPLGGSSRSLA